MMKSENYDEIGEMGCPPQQRVSRNGKFGKLNERLITWSNVYKVVHL